VTSPSSSVVICAYTLERWELIEEAVGSVVSQDPPPDQLVVVSDHNPDLFARVQAAHPNVTVIENPNAAGLSGARNAGLAASSGEIIAFLDDDAAAAPGWLANLIAGYADPTVQAVGGAIEPRWIAGRPRWFPAEFDWVVGCSYLGQPRTVADVRNVIGANMSFRRAIVETIGGFRQGLGRVGETPVGGEETELCIRIAQHDPTARIVLHPGALVRHTVPAGRGRLRYFVRRCFAEGWSKAAISRTVGRGAGLASERGYATRTLPAGVARGLREVVRGDPFGAARAAAIVVGLAVTTAGYVVGVVVPKLRRARPAAATQSGLGTP
jgi:O-antigen biosynthesis protein